MYIKFHYYFRKIINIYIFIAKKRNKVRDLFRKGKTDRKNMAKTVNISIFIKQS